MPIIFTREQQLARLRADRERDLASERAVIELAVSIGVLPTGTDQLFEHPGQYPGWHDILTGLVNDLASDEHSLLSGFTVIGGALASCANDGILARELVLFMDAADRTSLTCCVCGSPRGWQRLSRALMSCDVCAGVDLLMKLDPDAAEARGWHAIT